MRSPSVVNINVDTDGNAPIGDIVRHVPFDGPPSDNSGTGGDRPTCGHRPMTEEETKEQKGV